MIFEGFINQGRSTFDAKHELQVDGGVAASESVASGTCHTSGV